VLTLFRLFVVVMTDNKIFSKTGIVFGFIGLSLLVYTLAGYNYFLGTNQKTVIKLIAPLILFLVYQRLDDVSLRRVVFGFFSVSIGFLVAWILRGVPGVLPIDVDSVLGWGVSKFAEAAPICFCVFYLGRRNGDSFVSLGLREGAVGRSIVYGLFASVLGFVQYFAMFGFVFGFSFAQVLAWFPWLLLFSVSNAVLEELIFRGLFLEKIGVLLGEKWALFLISFIFAVFHVALLPFMGLSMMIVFTSFLFIQGYVWGYILQKTGSLWGGIIAHAFADILFVLAVFSG